MTILDSFKLDQKVALVTGANRGIGRSMALGLAEAGANIVGLNRQPDSHELEKDVTQLGRDFLHIQCDLGQTTVADLKQIVQEVVERFGRLDILVNNAGTISRAPAIEYGEEDWDRVVQVNLKAAFFLSQAAAQVMAPRGGGKIIQVSSVLGYQGGILVPPYAATKHGIIGVTRALANEWAAHHINVNCIAPGYIATDINAQIREDPVRNAAVLGRIPAGRYGTPDDLKGIVVFLASKASDYMHGSIVTIDGAWLSR